MRPGFLPIAGVFYVDRTSLPGQFFLGALGVRELSGTIFASPLDIVVLWQRRNEHGVFAELPWMTKNNLRAAVVFLNRSVDFNRSTFELANISDMLEIVCEYHNRERAGVEIFAEIEEGNPFAALFDVKNGAPNTLGRTNVLVSVGKGDTIRGSQTRHEEWKREHDRAQRL